MVKVNWIKEVEKIKVNNLETLCLTINDGKKFVPYGGYFSASGIVVILRDYNNFMEHMKRISVIENSWRKYHEDSEYIKRRTWNTVLKADLYDRLYEFGYDKIDLDRLIK